MSEINKPEVKTFYIIKNSNDELIDYGAVETHQNLTTGQPTLIPFTDRQVWIDELKKTGVEVTPEEFI